MNRPSLSSMAAAVFALALAPVVVMFGVIDLPSLSEIRASKTADIVGVWVITWGLILLGVAAAGIVAWLAWTSEAATQELGTSAGPDESGARSVSPTQRSVA
ncbi:MAG: hypothetical protein ABJA98_14965 [Acidobacteriota bacterium]